MKKIIAGLVLATAAVAKFSEELADKYSIKILKEGKEGT